MHSHYCPKCGQALIYQQCKKVAHWGLTQVLCPACSVHAEHSGGILLVLGLIITFAGGMIIALSDIALVIGAGFCVVGVIRLIRQFRIARSYASMRKNI